MPRMRHTLPHLNFSCMGARSPCRGQVSQPLGVVVFGRATFSGITSAGALLVADADVLSIKHSTFSGCIGTQGTVGGALQIMNCASWATVTDVTFADNRASSGGAVYTSGCNANFDSVRFLRNNASGGNGGAVFSAGASTDVNSGSSLGFKGCTFDGNSAASAAAAGGSGGGLYAEAQGPVRSENLLLENVQMINNRAEGDGGMLSFVHPGTNKRFRVTVNGCNATGNTARRFGGAVHVRKARLEVTATLFAGNTAGSLAEGSGSGGAVAVQNCRACPPFATVTSGTTSNTDTIFTGCTFIGNQAGSRGGAVVLYGTGGNCDNKLWCFGSATPIAGETFQMARFFDPNPANVNQPPSTYINNTAGAEGGAVYSVGNQVSMNKARFEGNVAATRPGLVILDGYLDTDTLAATPAYTQRGTSILNGRFINNRCSAIDGSGGGMSATGITMRFNLRVRLRLGKAWAGAPGCVHGPYVGRYLGMHGWGPARAGRARWGLEVHAVCCTGGGQHSLATAKGLGGAHSSIAFPA